MTFEELIEHLTRSGDHHDDVPSFVLILAREEALLDRIKPKAGATHDPRLHRVITSDRLQLLHDRQQDYRKAHSLAEASRLQHRQFNALSSVVWTLSMAEARRLRQPCPGGSSETGLAA